MTSNYNKTEAEAEEIEYKNEMSHSMYLGLLLHYITYQLFYCIGHIQMTRNYSTIEVEAEEIEYKNERSNFLL